MNEHERHSENDKTFVYSLNPEKFFVFISNFEKCIQLKLTIFVIRGKRIEYKSRDRDMQFGFFKMDVFKILSSRLTRLNVITVLNI